MMIVHSQIATYFLFSFARVDKLFIGKLLVAFTVDLEFVFSVIFWSFFLWSLDYCSLTDVTIETEYWSTDRAFLIYETIKPWGTPSIGRRCRWGEPACALVHRQTHTDTHISLRIGMCRHAYCIIYYVLYAGILCMRRLQSKANIRVFVFVWKCT